MTIDRIIRSALPAAILLGLMLHAPGCKHVSLDDGADSVRVIDSEEAKSCDRLGRTKVQVLNKIVGFERNEEKVSEELAMLARNRAVEMSGNAVAPDGEIEDAKQTFGIYRCPQP